MARSPSEADRPVVSKSRTTILSCKSVVSVVDGILMFQAECTAIPPKLPRIVMIKLVGRFDSFALLLFYFVFLKIIRADNY
jgi:hypothetical protein